MDQTALILVLFFCIFFISGPLYVLMLTCRSSGTNTISFAALAARASAPSITEPGLRRLHCAKRKLSTVAVCSNVYLYDIEANAGRLNLDEW